MANLKNVSLLVLSSLLLLSSCSAGSSSEISSSEASGASEEGQSASSGSASNSSSEDENAISVSDAYYEIARAQSEELSYASSAVYRQESTSSRLSNVMEETYLTSEDGSTSSSGTYTKKEEGKEDQKDSFKRLSTEVNETYESESGERATYKMFVSVLDFENDDVGANPTYQDSASRLYILDEASEAGNLSEDQYILAEDFSLYCSANLSGKLASFLASNVVDNIYAEQCGVTSVSPSLDEEGNWDYAISYSYSYVEDGENVASEIKASYILDGEKKRLLSFSTSSKTTYSREGESEEAVSLYEESGSVAYGERLKSLPSDALNPEDYFLAEVKNVGLKAQNGFKEEIIKPNMTNEGYTVSASCSRISGFALSARPEKVLDTSLVAYASSNEEVVALEEGEFVIKGTGKVTLTFAYYKKDSSTGVYKFTKVRASAVNVKTSAPDSIHFANSSILNYELSLEEGKTYSWEYSVSPAKSSSEITLASSDPEVLAVSLDEEGKLKLEAKSGGVATITLASAVDPSIKTEKTFCVLEEMDYVSFLTSHTFYNINAWSTEITIKFNANGTGSRHIVQGESSLDDTFNWSNEGNELSFSFATTPELKPYEEGLIVGVIGKDGEFQGYGVSITCGEGDYSTNIYSVAD